MCLRPVDVKVKRKSLSSHASQRASVTSRDSNFRVRRLFVTLTVRISFRDLQARRRKNRLYFLIYCLCIYPLHNFFMADGKKRRNVGKALPIPTVRTSWSKTFN